MKNKTYDILKFITMVVLPATATLYVALSDLWHLPYVTEISGTITAIATFLGSILMISSNNYKKKEVDKNE